jgi:hypothetical protein
MNVTHFSAFGCRSDVTPKKLGTDCNRARVLQEKQPIAQWRLGIVEAIPVSGALFEFGISSFSEAEQLWTGGHAFGRATARVGGWLRMQYFLKYPVCDVVCHICYGFSVSKKD